MSLLNGQPVCTHAAQLFQADETAARFAVVGSTQSRRQTLLHSLGWTIVTNTDPALGQGLSLAKGIAAVRDRTSAQAALILLADMPLIPLTHLSTLAEKLDGPVQAVMSDVAGTLSPPAIFARSTFDALSKLNGDRGARALFNTLSTTNTHSLDPSQAIDIDQQADLISAEEALNG